MFADFLFGMFVVVCVYAVLSMLWNRFAFFSVRIRMFILGDNVEHEKNNLKCAKKSHKDFDEFVKNNIHR